jgi:cytochrome c-type biogenesis protein CcmH/NrfG
VGRRATAGVARGGTEMTARLRSLPAGSTWWASGFLAFVVVTVTTDVAFAVVMLVIAALAFAGLAVLRRTASVGPLHRRALATILLGFCVALTGLAAHILQAGTGPALRLPLSATAVQDASAAQDAAMLTQELPDRSSSWLLLGDTGDPTTPLSSAYLGYERALIADPHQVRAALGLARLYLARNQSLLDVEIADFYTQLAGFHSPPLRPAS